MWYELLLWPFLACLVLTGIHCYLGIHVVGRGVIFVDLAMAQIAFLGSAVGFLVIGAHYEPPPPEVQATLDAQADLAPPEQAGTAPAIPSDEPITEDAVEQLIPPDVPAEPAGAEADHEEGPSGTTETPGHADEPSGHVEIHTHQHHAAGAGTAGYLGGLAFTILGAALFALGRLRHRHIPQEAFIGIIYAVSTAAALVLLYKSPHDIAEQTRGMLVGRILFVDMPTVLKTAALYAGVGLLHFLWRRPFLAISFHEEDAEARGLRIRWWDFLFYATFGVIVTSSVQMGGVLLVFSYLIVPAVCAMLFFTKVSARLWFGWAIGFSGSVAGIVLSVFLDAPAGASIVIAFGGILIVLLVVRVLGGPGVAELDGAGQ